MPRLEMEAASDVRQALNVQTPQTPHQRPVRLASTHTWARLLVQTVQMVGSVQKQTAQKMLHVWLGIMQQDGRRHVQGALQDMPVQT